MAARHIKRGPFSVATECGRNTVNRPPQVSLRQGFFVQRQLPVRLALDAFNPTLPVPAGFSGPSPIITQISYKKHQEIAGGNEGLTGVYEGPGDSIPRPLVRDYRGRPPAPSNKKEIPLGISTGIVHCSLFIINSILSPAFTAPPVSTRANTPSLGMMQLPTRR